MTVEALYVLRRAEAASELAELDAVELTADVRTDDGDMVRASTRGTIVGTWGGHYFEVEFPEPEGALATVSGKNLRRVA